MSEDLLRLDDVTLDLPVREGMRPILTGVSLRIRPGEMVGLVGESGSGKSMTARTSIRLLPEGAHVRGGVFLNGADVLSLDERALRRLRRSSVAMVFQDPRAHVNPVRTVGDFLCEGMRSVQQMSRGRARGRALELLDAVGITDGERRMRQYPHQLSGGMLQRVMIAAALAAEPKLLLADEPTTALDVTIQEEIVAIIDDLRRTFGLGVLMITHDLNLAAATCDRICVMYAGRIVEAGVAPDVVGRPLHPYTRGLLTSRPDLAGGAIQPIPGRPLAAFEAPHGCSFAPRCAHVRTECTTAEPALREAFGGVVACIRAEELREDVALER